VQRENAQGGILGAREGLEMRHGARPRAAADGQQRRLEVSALRRVPGLLQQPRQIPRLGVAAQDAYRLRGGAAYPRLRLGGGAHNLGQGALHVPLPGQGDEHLAVFAGGAP